MGEQKPPDRDGSYVSQTEHPRCAVQGRRCGEETGRCTVVAIRRRDGYELYPHGAAGMCVLLDGGEAAKLGAFLAGRVSP